MLAPAILIALVASAMLGMALMATVVLDRRRKATRGRIGNILSPFTSLEPMEEVTPRLDRQQKDKSPAGLRLMPRWLRERIKDAAALAGGRITPTRLTLVGLGAAILAGFFFAELLGLGPISIAVLCMAAAIGAPLALIRFEKMRYDRKFLDVFPDALDLIVRAIRSGLPVAEAVTNVGEEVGDPVGKEFRSVSDEMSIAVDMDRALRQAADRIRITDFQFFVAALALQRQTGGNLADTLSNLSSTVRRRNEVRLKVRALSSEGRISALVLSAMPIVLGLGVDLLNPEYAALLLHDPRGHKLIAVGLVSLVMGIMVMRGMIRRVMT